MSKKSFEDIEQIIKNAAEAHEPAFDEESWKKMEALLDKETDRRRPVAFWLWWLFPLLIGGSVVSYFIFNKNDNQQKIATLKNDDPAKENIKSNAVDINKNLSEPDAINSTNRNDQLSNMQKEKKTNTRVSLKVNRSLIFTAASNDNLQNNNEELFAKKNLSGTAKGKLTGKITSVKPISDEKDTENLSTSNNPDLDKNNNDDQVKQEEVIVVKVDADKVDEKEIGKIIDSVVNKSNSDKKAKDKIYRFYIIAAAGAEASGVKLFSTDKVTARVGLALGYQFNKNLSVQTGFFVSSKKYKASGSDYKTKPGSYWNMMDIKSLEANCRVYEIPVTIRYDFTPGKKLNIFAAAGLSSYIMKKEDYYFYYDRYGASHQAEALYSGNKNLFSVLRLSAGAEKKISKRISVFASPGIAIPLSGVGEGEVKLYSTDIIIGLKFSALQKK